MVWKLAFVSDQFAFIACSCEAEPTREGHLVLGAVDGNDCRINDWLRRFRRAAQYDQVSMQILNMNVEREISRKSVLRWGAIQAHGKFRLGM